MTKKNDRKKNTAVTSDTEALDHLRTAINDWTPESSDSAEISHEASDETSDEASDAIDTSEIRAKIEKSRVVMIQDPFGITPSEDLPEDELLLSEEEAESEDSEDSEEADPDEQFAQLQSAMNVEQAKQIDELTEVSGETEEAAQARLAREIAEDLALESQEEELAAAELEADPELRAALPQIPLMGEDGELDLTELQSCVETLLFLSDKPVTAKKLREMLGEQIPFPAIQESITQLQDRYSQPMHGIELAEINGGFQIRTKPIRAALAKKLARVVVQRLSTGAMETLAIMAYKQPVMKEEIDQIRGVDSAHFIRTLLDRKLVRIAGRSELPGRPMLYATSDEFLEMFGLKDLESLPPLRELESMIPMSQSGQGEEDPRVKQMRKLVQEMKANSQSILDYNPKDDEQFLQDIREKVNAIPVSTATLDAQREAEKAAKHAKEAARKAGVTLEPQANPEGQYVMESAPLVAEPGSVEPASELSSSEI